MKKYPFSIAKHGHDIEFRINRIKNIRDDMRDAGTMTDELEERADNVLEALYEILSYYPEGGVVWLPGKLYGIAKETAIWASETRAATLIAHGKTEYLQYC